MKKRLILFCVGMLITLSTSQCRSQNKDFDQKPILYSQTQAFDPVATLIQQIHSGEKSLVWDKKHGWLPSLLNELSIPASSQLLVFSKTSLQIRHISPANPRAIYFNDNVYIGAVPNAPLIEIAAVDPKLGAVFYTIDTQKKDHAGHRAAIHRDNTNCLSCHGTGKTQNVPGFLTRSVYTQANGQPRFELGTTTTNVSTDFLDRFGGWYITGLHGEMRHRGNLFVGADSDKLAYDQGANQIALPARIRSGKFITDSSDLVAMMVLEHQSQMHNAITKASYTFVTAMASQTIMNEALERAKDFVSASTDRRLQSAAENVVDHLLFAGEFSLRAPISGSSSFVKDFQTDRVEDSLGRSLRDFDLNSRLFRYPCSYLIYTNSFDGLPRPMLDRIYKYLHTALSEPTTEGFEHLSSSDRQAILEILVQTKPKFKTVVAQLNKR